MATHKSPLRHHRPLTFQQRQALDFGPLSRMVSEFGGETEARRAWEHFRAELISLHPSRTWSRPQAFWQFTPGVPARLRDKPPHTPSDDPGVSLAGIHQCREFQDARERWLRARGVWPENE